MVFDSARGHCVMFGGEDSTSIFAQTWLYEYSPTGGSWTAGPAPPAQPTFGINHAMAYDSTNGVSVLFGGTMVNYVWGGTFELNHTYVPSGTYETATFDAGGPVANWGYLNWTGQEPLDTNIQFRIASNNDGNPPWNYEGPTGPGDYYNATSGTPDLIAATHNGNRYLRIMVFLDTADISVSPKLDNVSITYNMAPDDPTLEAPIGSAIVYLNMPRFNWTHNDPDGDIQDAFQVLVDDDPMLGSPTCDSGITVSSNDYWDYTGCPVLADGTYYWSVRTRDEDGVWSNWPTSQEFIVNINPSNLSLGSPNYTAAGTTYFSSTTPFTLTALGSASSKYSIWDAVGGWLPVATYTVPFTISGADGTRFVSYYSTDVFGNNEATRNYSSISGLYLDDTSPTTTLTIGSPKFIDGGNTYFTSSTQFTIASDDGMGSGSNPWFRIWNSTSGWSSWTPYSGPFTISGNDGTHYIQYNGTDNVGNVEATHNYSSISQLILDNTPPWIEITNPDDDALNVPVTQDIVITFSEKINRSSFIFDCTPDPLGWNWDWTAGDTVATGTHNAFTEGTPYEFNVTQAEDLIGNSLVPGPVPNPWNITTIAASPSPMILSTTPSDDQQDVPLFQSIIIQFSKQIDRPTFDFTIDPDPLGWGRVWSDSDRKVTMTHAPFILDENYTFTVISADDMSGNPLVGGPVPNPWNWTTVTLASPPTIIETTPADGDTVVGLDQDVIITFSKEMNPSTLNITSTPDPGGWNWVWSAGNTVATGSHDTFLLSTTYVFEVNAANDTFGNPLAASPMNTWYWETTSDPISPKITGTSPLNSETEVQVDSDVVITFSETIDRDTFDFVVAPDPGSWTRDWQLGDTVVVLSHEDFDYKTVYALHVTAAFDLIGNALVPSQTAENPWYWTTEDAPITTGTITGRILNESSTILVGAVVQLIDNSGAAVSVVLTNATGHFTFQDVPFGEYNISASFEDYSTNDTANATISSSVQSHDVGDIVLTPSVLRLGKVTGMVTDSEGRRIRNANITLIRFDGEPAGWATTDSFGNYTIDNVTFGIYRLRISHNDYEMFTSGYFTLDQDNPNFNTMTALSTEEQIADEGLIPEWLWWIILLILIIVIIGLAAALGVSRRRKPVEALLTYKAPPAKPPAKKVEEKPKVEEEMVVCPYCDAEIPEDAAKCPKCGEEFEEGFDEEEVKDEVKDTEKEEPGEGDEIKEEGVPEEKVETEKEAEGVAPAAAAAAAPAAAAAAAPAAAVAAAPATVSEAARKCSQCGEEVGPGHDACPYCGGDVEEEEVSTTCSKCGKPLESKYKLCPFCGTPRQENE
jgi:RNA polymerase subunit RPABC4/transcription elongation factor Spt4